MAMNVTGIGKGDVSKSVVAGVINGGVVFQLSDSQSERRQTSSGTVYHSLFCRVATLSQDSGTVSYPGGSFGTTSPVAQLISKCPLTPEANCFSFRIMNEGKKCAITIGLVPSNYPPGRQPGWNPFTIGYHADDGGVYDGSSSRPVIRRSKARVGDIMKCEFDFSDNTATFYNTGRAVYKSPPLKRVPVGGYHAIVGMNSEFESVQLLETAPWRDQ